MERIRLVWQVLQELFTLIVCAFSQEAGSSPEEKRQNQPLLSFFYHIFLIAWFLIDHIKTVQSKKKKNYTEKTATAKKKTANQLQSRPQIIPWNLWICMWICAEAAMH